MILRGYKIYLNTIERVKSFVTYTTDLDFPVDVMLGRYVIDGTSIMGIFSLNLSEKLKVIPHTDDLQQLIAFEEFMSKYSIKGEE